MSNLAGGMVDGAAPGCRGLGSYRGYAKDAFIIGDQTRMRRDIQAMHQGDDIAVDLRILTSRRLDPAADRTRTINRMRAQLLG
ncbi:transposase [Streptomyces sp. NPDC101149]|uniref:IS110 family transposase n=1 Tax=Streptomyces sp. NPDC101149 TaxID=3366113 RepID=UPI003827D164